MRPLSAPWLGAPSLATDVPAISCCLFWRAAGTICWHHFAERPLRDCSRGLSLAPQREYQLAKRYDASSACPEKMKCRCPVRYSRCSPPPFGVAHMACRRRRSPAHPPTDWATPSACHVSDVQPPALLPTESIWKSRCALALLVRPLADHSSRRARRFSGSRTITCSDPKRPGGLFLQRGAEYPHSRHRGRVSHQVGTRHLLGRQFCSVRTSRRNTARLRCLHRVRVFEPLTWISCRNHSRPRRPRRQVARQTFMNSSRFHAPAWSATSVGFIRPVASGHHVTSRPFDGGQGRGHAHRPPVDRPGHCDQELEFCVT